MAKDTRFSKDQDKHAAGSQFDLLTSKAVSKAPMGGASRRSKPMDMDLERGALHAVVVGGGDRKKWGKRSTVSGSKNRLLILDLGDSSKKPLSKKWWEEKHAGYSVVYSGGNHLRLHNGIEITLIYSGAETIVGSGGGELSNMMLPSKVTVENLPLSEDDAVLFKLIDKITDSIKAGEDGLDRDTEALRQVQLSRRVS